MSDAESAGFSRRGLFVGSGLGLVAGALGAQLLSDEKSCVGEALPTNSPASRQALRDLVNTLNDYDQEYIERGFGGVSELDFAEGERYLTHLFRVGCNLFVEQTADHPVMVPIVSPTLKLMGDNADAYYFYAPLKGDRRYRIKGRRTGEVYISFTAHTGGLPGAWATGVSAILNNTDIDFDEQGNFELTLGPNESGRNTIRTTTDTVEIISRHYFMNETYAASDPMVNPLVAIENLDDVPLPGAPTDASIAAQLQALNRFIRANSIERPLMNPLSTPEWFSLVPNTLGPPMKWNPDDDAGGWGAMDNGYSAGRFELAPDEALVIEGVMPECIFSNVLLWNRYLQTFDYRYRQVSLNKRQMGLGTGDKFRVIVAHEDPGLPNWLDTEGRSNGIVYWRFLMPEGAMQEMTTQVVKIKDLA